MGGGCEEYGCASVCLSVDCGVPIVSGFANQRRRFLKLLDLI